jgi:hypothetical protein
MSIFRQHPIATDTVITYVHPNNGQRTTDRVIRIEGNHAIVSRPTIGGTWRDFPVHESFIISYTNTLQH